MFLSHDLFEKAFFADDLFGENIIIKVINFILSGEFHSSGHNNGLIGLKMFDNIFY
jgi:hypothetical protein